MYLDIKQDGPSLESSSYLNVTLRYVGPLDLGMLGPLDPLTLGLFDFRTLGPLPSSTISSYLFLLLLPISSYTGLVWFGMGGGDGTVRNPPWNPGTSSFLLHSLPLPSSHLLLIPPSYSNLLPTPSTSS